MDLSLHELIIINCQVATSENVSIHQVFYCPPNGIYLKRNRWISKILHCAPSINI